MTPPDDFLRQMILDKIAFGEAHDYDELYGGHKFSGFAGHPQVEALGPDGKPTSAAGRYQFEKGTWANEAKRLGLKDFSPASQDSAAWDLAQRTYSEKTGGRDILADARQGGVNWSALSGQWPSLGPKAKVSPMAPAQEVGSYPLPPIASLLHPIPEDAPIRAPENGLMPPPPPSDLTGQLMAPSKGNLNPLMLMALMAPHLQFHPVDYDPWKILGDQKEQA